MKEQRPAPPITEADRQEKLRQQACLARQPDEKNTTAAVTDELRTEGHAIPRARRACPHETP